MKTHQIHFSRPKLRAAAPEPGKSTTGWPINEILLESLEARGLSDVEIAKRFQVTWRQVAVLREKIR